MPDDHSSHTTTDHDEVDFFFETFEDREPALVHQDETAGGQQSQCNKLVRR